MPATERPPTSIVCTWIRSTSSRAASRCSSTTRRSCCRRARSPALPRSTSRARFLNFHTPGGGFAENLRARDRGEPGGFDSVDASPGSGRPGSEAIFFPPGDGERLEGTNRVATIKVGVDELALIEFELEPGFEGPDPHTHDDHVDSFYVLEGEPEFLAGDERLRLGAGSYVAAPIGTVHAFSNPGPQRARVLNVHAPSTGFHDQLREMSG
jgi:quercetin dioxygenase-like cupin family protein